MRRSDFFAGRPLRSSSFLFAVALLITGIGNTEEREGKPLTVSIIAPSDLREEYDALVENTVAQMEGLPCGVHLYRTPIFELGNDAIAKEAEKILLQGTSRVVFWCDLTKGEDVHFAYLTPSGTRLLVRGLKGSGHEGVIDAVALIARTTVETLLDTGLLEETVPPDIGNKSVTPAAHPSGALPSPLVESEASRPIRWAIRAAYVPQWISSAPIVVHSGRFELQLKIKSVIRIGMGASIGSLVERKSEEIRLRQTKVPFHLGVLAYAKIGRLGFGGGANILFSIVKTEPTSRSETVIASDTERKFAASFELPLEFLFRPVDKIELFFGGAIEIITKKSSYRVRNGETWFDDTMWAQPKIFVGIALFPM